MAEPTDLHAKIWSFLIEHFAGLENASPRAAILQRFNLINKTEINDRDFRYVISDLRIIFKKPICSAPSTGYFVACGEEEKQVSLRYLDSILTEIGDLRRNLAGAVPLGAKQKQERLL